MIGMTEFGGIVVLQTNDEKLNSIGTVAKNVQMKIIDPDSGKILGPNETGEACFKSPHMMIKYYNNPEKTKEAIDTDGKIKYQKKNNCNLFKIKLFNDFYLILTFKDGCILVICVITMKMDIFLLLTD